MKMEAASLPDPVTPEFVHGLGTERFIKPVRHWFDGLSGGFGKIHIPIGPIR